MPTPPDPSEQPTEERDAASAADSGEKSEDESRHEGSPGAVGLFGGPLAFEHGRSSEPAPPEILKLLADRPDSGFQAPSTVDLVRFRAASGRVEHSADLSGLVPILEAGLSPPDLVAIVARVATALAAMHAAGERHGDLGPWSIRVGKGRVALLTPPPGVPEGALIAARVRRSGAPLSDAAYCSGGALAGREGGPANDVFALAGVAHRLVSGELPVGHVDVSAAARSPLRDLAAMVFAGLAAKPSQRPPMAAFEAAVWQSVRAEPPTPWASPPEQAPSAESASAASEPVATNMPVAGAAASTPVGPAREPRASRPRNVAVGGQAPPAAWSPPVAPPAAWGQRGGPGARPEGKQLSTVLTLLLVVGGLFVLVGALWIVAVGWAILGEGGRAGLLFALTAGIAAGGFTLEKKGYKSSGFALVVLASQMLWADGGYVLNLADALSSVGAWSGVAAFVTAVSALLAVNRKSLGAGVLAALGFTVFAICFNVATGRPGQLVFFSALTLSALLGGLLAVRRERPALGTALLVAGSQLLWIDAGCLLDLAGSVDSEGAWTAVAGLVFAATAVIAFARKSAVTGIFAAFDFLVFAGLFAHLTGRPGQLGLTLAVTATLALAGARQAKKGQEILAAVLTIAATQLLWADAALFLDLIDVAKKPGPWALASGVILAVTYGVTLRLYPSAALLAALDASVFAACFGAFISRGDPLGPPIYALAVAGLYAAMSAGAHRAKRPVASGLFAGFGVLSVFSSAGAAVALLDRESHVIFGSLWPIVPTVCLAPFAFGGAPPPEPAKPGLLAVPAHRILAQIGIAVLLGTVPAAEALQRPNDAIYVVAAAVVGCGAAFAALRVPAWQIQIAGGLIALLNAVFVPSAAFLDKCSDAGGLTILTGPAAPYMIAALGAPIALLVAAAFSNPDSTRKAGYRMVEVAALLQLFGLTTLASLMRSSDFFYPAVILATGTFALALGALRRHVVIVGLASGALLLNLWIQYFQKLRDTFPTAVLVIGFGIGLLVAGVVYERKIRHVLPKLREWS